MGVSKFLVLAMSGPYKKGQRVAWIENIELLDPLIKINSTKPLLYQAFSFLTLCAKFPTAPALKKAS
jgi:hypothetical protein